MHAFRRPIELRTVHNFQLLLQCDVQVQSRGINLQSRPRAQSISVGCVAFKTTTVYGLLNYEFLGVYMLSRRALQHDISVGACVHVVLVCVEEG